MEEDEAENGDTDADVMPEKPAAAIASSPFLLLKGLGPRRKRARILANLRHASPPLPPPPSPPPLTQGSDNEVEAENSSGEMSPRHRNGDACSEEDESGSLGPRVLIRSEPTSICPSAPRRRKWRSSAESTKLRAMRAVTPNFAGLPTCLPAPPHASSAHTHLPAPTVFSPALPAHLTSYAPIGLPSPQALNPPNRVQQPGLALPEDHFDVKASRLCSPGTTWEAEVVASTTPAAQMEEPDSTTQLAVKTEPVSFLSDSVHASQLYCYNASPAPPPTPLPYVGAGNGGAGSSPVIPPALQEPLYRPPTSYSFTGAYTGFDTPTPVSGAYQLESSRLDAVATTLASSSTSCLSAASSSTSPNGMGLIVAPSSSTAMLEECGKEERRGRAGPGATGRRVQPETELSLYRNKMENTRCGVCSDTAAGFHCGAYVCEACKKFYIRSHKGDNANRYQCTKMGQCEVNKDTRTHCQYCRYKKCEILGMYPPGSKPNESSNISIIPCRVCGAQSSGFHFGAITCEGCKGFFRRTINERESNRYQCSKGGRCDITVHTRNNCKSCRYMKCLAVNMSKTGSRIGRQPNAIKHMCAKEIEAIQSRYGFGPARSGPPPSGLDKAADLALLAGPVSPVAPKLSPSSLSGSPAAAALRSPDPKEASGRDGILLAPKEELSMRLLSEERFLRVSENLQKLRNYGEEVVKSAEVLKSVAHRDPKSTLILHPGFRMEEVWEMMMNHFALHVQQVVHFARALPDFEKLSNEDKRVLVTEAMYPIILIKLGQCYNPVTGEYNYFNFRPEEREVIMSHFPSFTKICEHLTVSGSFIQQCAFDDKTIALLCAILLTRSHSDQIGNRTDVNNMHLRCVGALKIYLSERNEAVSRLQLSQISYLEDMLAHMNMEHHDIVMQLKQTHVSLVFPILFLEMFQLVEEKELIEEAVAVAMASSSSTTASFTEYMETQPPSGHLLPHMLQHQQQQQFHTPADLTQLPQPHLEPHQPHQG